MAPRTLVIITVSLLLCLFPSLFQSLPENLTFDFPSLSLRNLSLLGDSYLRNGAVGLTRDLSVPSTGSGSVLYSNPVRFIDTVSNTTASFSTRFSFAVRNLNPASYGDGLAFFLSPDNYTLGSPGGYLGLPNSTESARTKFIAIEFDTKQDLHFDDPNNNHIGLDIGTLVSIETANPSLYNIDLKSGELITAWIDYKNDFHKLNVYLSYNVFKPDLPLLTFDIDLSYYLQEYMYVGFSASTEGSTEVHLVQNWRFQTKGFKPHRPKFLPHNVSENSVIKPPIPIPNSPNSHRMLGLGLGIAGPAFFCAFLTFFCYFSVKKWRNIQIEKSLKAELVTGPKQFGYKDLKVATKGFHSSRILGNGAFGTVYKAFFEDECLAVKRSKHAHEGKTEFLAELSIIACLRHKNLVPLQGWCVEKGELLLVYEFMPNGSLDKVLYQDSNNPLNWTYRYNICIGLASALTYLHQECEQQVIHRDIKASNIMLDGNFNARLGDFGLARLMDHDKSPVSTLTAGTMGYLAPEYLQYGIATEKTDVFSYGVVLLEVACGRRPIERGRGSEKMVNLVDWVWGLHSEGRIIEGADERLGGEYDDVAMMRVLLLGLGCANPDSAARPSMRRVLQILNGESEILGVPKMKPGLSFSCGVPLSIEDIVSEDEDFEIKIG